MCCLSDGNNSFAPLGFCPILSAESAIRTLFWVLVPWRYHLWGCLATPLLTGTIMYNSMICSARLNNTKPLYLGMRSCVCDVHRAASIFIFCFWNQQRNDAIQSLLTEERKWHIWCPAVIPCVLWESDYFSRAGRLKWDPLLFLTYALR